MAGMAAMRNGDTVDDKENREPGSIGDGVGEKGRR